MGTSRIDVKCLGRVWGPAEDGCEVSRTSLGTSRIAVRSLKESWTSSLAVKSLGRNRDRQYSCEVSMTSLGTNRIAVKSLESQGPAV